mmetsp:Transcript_108651/g.307132  ORF Transcript_108651/g.307132 Transcript_108651/m.307132 type:complete len:214 (-) Transcript_108651:119-760(-)
MLVRLGEHMPETPYWHCLTSSAVQAIADSRSRSPWGRCRRLDLERERSLQGAASWTWHHGHTSRDSVGASSSKRQCAWPTASLRMLLCSWSAVSRRPRALLEQRWRSAASTCSTATSSAEAAVGASAYCCTRRSIPPRTRSPFRWSWGFASRVRRFSMTVGRCRNGTSLCCCRYTDQSMATCWMRLLSLSARLSPSTYRSQCTPLMRVCWGRP